MPRDNKRPRKEPSFGITPTLDAPLKKDPGTDSRQLRDGESRTQTSLFHRTMASPRNKVNFNFDIDTIVALRQTSILEHANVTKTTEQRGVETTFLDLSRRNVQEVTVQQARTSNWIITCNGRNDVEGKSSIREKESTTEGKVSKGTSTSPASRVASSHPNDSASQNNRKKSLQATSRHNDGLKNNQTWGDGIGPTSKESGLNIFIRQQESSGWKLPSETAIAFGLREQLVSQRSTLTKIDTCTTQKGRHHSVARKECGEANILEAEYRPQIVSFTNCVATARLIEESHLKESTKNDREENSGYKRIDRSSKRVVSSSSSITFSKHTVQLSMENT